MTERATYRSITLADRDAEERAYVLLDGDPGDHAGGMLTAYVMNAGTELATIEVQSWYWSSFGDLPGGWVTDPEASVSLPAGAFRFLSEAIRDQLGIPDDADGGGP